MTINYHVFNLNPKLKIIYIYIYISSDFYIIKDIK